MPTPRKPRTPSRCTNEQLAQELVYEAMMAATRAQQQRFLRQALQLDPENVDARLMVAEESDLPEEERIEELRAIVASAATQLGQQAFRELAGQFWGFLETRPYMRARERLASALVGVGRLDEAAREYAEMLELNENDNQGVRYQLLPVLLAQSRLDEARVLMKRYADDLDWNAVFAWGRLLERLLSGDDQAASDALAVARKQNPHVEAYLTGRRKLPKSLPGVYSPGSKDEALCFAEPLHMAWTPHSTARAWLSRQKRKASMDSSDN